MQSLTVVVHCATATIACWPPLKLQRSNVMSSAGRNTTTPAPLNSDMAIVTSLNVSDADPVTATDMRFSVPARSTCADGE